MPSENYIMTKLETRFWKKVEKQQNGCWLWRGATTNDYGSFWIPQLKRCINAHRFLSGDIAVNKGVVFHHTCPNKLCVNPDHLVKLTRSTHLLEHPRKLVSHCGLGHEFTENNTYIMPTGQRRCRTCARQRNCGYYRRRNLVPVKMYRR